MRGPATHPHAPCAGCLRAAGGANKPRVCSERNEPPSCVPHAHEPAECVEMDTLPAGSPAFGTHAAGLRHARNRFEGVRYVAGRFVSMRHAASRSTEWIRVTSASHIDVSLRGSCHEIVSGDRKPRLRTTRTGACGAISRRGLHTVEWRHFLWLAAPFDAVDSTPWNGARTE